VIGYQLNFYENIPDDLMIGCIKINNPTSGK